MRFSSTELQAAAVTAAEGWKFNPGSKDGRPVGGWLTIPVMFSLGGDVKPRPDGQAYALEAPFECVSTAPPFVPPASTRWSVSTRQRRTWS
ncbi:MAG: energy transducer TonB [Rhodanobacteraceae bacterium]